MESIKITDAQADQIKKQLLSQLEKFPEDKKDQIKKQINSMSTEEVEEFVKKNQLDHLQQCVFCSIIEGKTPSFKIDEDEENIAILEINPVTKGHTLILPRNHRKENLDSTKSLAEKVSEKIKAVFKPRNIKVRETKILEHPVVELLPIYKETPDNPKRKKATDEELNKVQEELMKPLPEKKPQEVKNLEEENQPRIDALFKLPPRIP